MASEGVRFPGESDEYRAARNSLLQAEMELRRNLEAVAEQRRKLPLGGRLKEDYSLEGAGDSPGSRPRHLRFSELFAPGKDTLIVYSYMFGPKMKSPCSCCTSILDGLDGEAPHVEQRVNLAVVAKSPYSRIAEFAQERGWRHLRLLSSAGTTYNRDYHAENADEGQLPVMNVFVRREGVIHHTYATELLFAPSEPHQGERHVDLLWPLWNLFDLTPEGRGTAWNPRLTY